MRVNRGSTHQSTDTGVPSAVRQPLHTGPGLDKRLRLVARIERLLCRPHGRRVVYEACDAVVRHKVPRAEAIDVARERPVSDAALVTYAVATEARDGVQDIGGVEAANIPCFVPVPGFS